MIVLVFSITKFRELKISYWKKLQPRKILEVLKNEGNLEGRTHDAKCSVILLLIIITSIDIMNDNNNNDNQITNSIRNSFEGKVSD